MQALCSIIEEFRGLWGAVLRCGEQHDPRRDYESIFVASTRPGQRRARNADPSTKQQRKNRTLCVYASGSNRTLRPRNTRPTVRLYIDRDIAHAQIQLQR